MILRTIQVSYRYIKVLEISEDFSNLLKFDNLTEKVSRARYVDTSKMIEVDIRQND
jgi:hypothetical protein